MIIVEYSPGRKKKNEVFLYVLIQKYQYNMSLYLCLEIFKDTQEKVVVPDVRLGI